MGVEEFPGLADIRADVDIADIDKHPSSPAGIFAFDHIRPLMDVDFGDLGHGNLGATGRGDEDTLEGGEIFPVVLEIADIDRITLQALHSLGNLHAAQGGEDDVLNFPDHEAITGGGLAVDNKVHVIAAQGPFRYTLAVSGMVLRRASVSSASLVRTVRSCLRI